MKRVAAAEEPSERPRCASCYWAEWTWGGKCIRPDARYFRRRLRRHVEDPNLPSIGLRDFCGDHITTRQIRALSDPKVTEDAAPASVAAPAEDPDLNEVPETTDHLLALLKSRSQRQAS